MKNEKNTEAQCVLVASSRPSPDESEELGFGFGAPIPLFPDDARPESARAHGRLRKLAATACAHATTLAAHHTLHGARTYCRACGKDLGAAKAKASR